MSNRITAEAYWRSSDDASRSELVRGEIVRLPFRGAVAGQVVAQIGARIECWTASCSTGRAFLSTGYVLRRHPDTVLGPAISYVAEARIPPTGIPQAFWELAPDLAVEVISPTETAGDIQNKGEEYLEAGVRLVWVACPMSQTVVVFTPDGVARTLRGKALLKSAEVLPGFSCTVEDRRAMKHVLGTEYVLSTKY